MNKTEARKLDKLLAAIAGGKAPCTAFCGESRIEYSAWLNASHRDTYNSTDSVRELVATDPIAVKVAFV